MPLKENEANEDRQMDGYKIAMESAVIKQGSGLKRFPFLGGKETC